MDWTVIILMAAVAGGVGLTVLPRRTARIEDPRKDWAKARRNWAGAPDLRESGE